MYNWENIQTKTELEYVLDILKEKIGNSKIKKIFSFCVPSPNKNNNIIKYSSIDESLYILFDNDYALIIDFMFISSIYIEYRILNEEEMAMAAEEEDILNSCYETYGWDFDKNNNRIETSFRIKTIVNICGEYSEIDKFLVNGFSESYEKWISNGESSDIITIPSGGDYFDKLSVCLRNGIQIELIPAHAESDGYYYIKIYDNNNIIRYDKKEVVK